MSKFRFQLNSKGVRELLQSQNMLNICEQYARDIQSRAGEGYEVTTHSPGKTRVNASVHAATYEARKDNYDNNTLLKAMGGGR